MNTEIKYANLIQAALDGKTVQVRWGSDYLWEDYAPQAAIRMMCAASNDGYEYRVKPVTVMRWMVIWKLNGDVVSSSWSEKEKEAAVTIAKQQKGKLFRLEIDSEDLTFTTLEVVEALLDPPGEKA